MRKFLLLVVFVISALITVSQIVVPVSLQYSEITEQQTSQSNLNYVTFSGSQNILEFGAFPVYYYEVELPSEYFACEIEIDEFSSGKFTHEQSLILTDNELLDTEYGFSIVYSGTLAQIYVLPFKWDISQNEIVKLIDFDLLIDYVPVGKQAKPVKSSNDYVAESVLSTGEWIKMGIEKTGVHKLTYVDIENMGVNPAELNVNNIGIFGNYNGVLPEANNSPSIDDLQENSIFISGYEDGSFDHDDFILFYAQGATTWVYNPFGENFIHKNNIYSDTTYYFFTTDKGTAKPIVDITGTGFEPNQYVTTFSDYDVHELDLESLISSGKEWFGEIFTGDTLEREFPFLFPHINTDEPVYMSVDIAGRSFSDSYYDLEANNVALSDSTKIRLVTSSLGIYARKSSKNLTFLVEDDLINVKVKYYSDDANAMAWLNHITLNVERNLIFDGGQMKFCEPSVSASGNISQFDIKEANNSSTIWDITDIHNPKKVSYATGDNLISFVLPTDSLKTFTVFDNSDYFSPVSFKEVQNQNLHQINDVNFIIIRPEIFALEAEMLANIHREHDGLTTICVSPQQIYNEFSSGSQDISAIRNFMKMLYDRGAFGNERAYLLLFGDASFDYKHRIHDNTNMVPTYEAYESLAGTSSFVTDDYFGLLDDNEGAGASGNLDIGIGRFPITTNEEAISIVNKIIKYLSRNEDVMRDWRTNICFVADDEDRNLHFDQAEGLVLIANTLHKGIGINKVYLDAYKKITIPGGSRYPDASANIDKQIEHGALIVNYTGHGGVISWSEEHVLDVPMINGFNNFDNLPLIITATCEFSRFDDPEFTSAGEYFFLNEEGGAIALLTTTRLAYAHANYIVNKRIYNNLLQCDEGNKPRLGDLVRLSKIPSNDNYLNFVLLGDPALTLAYPEHDIVTNTTINGHVNVLDTIHALSIVAVSGEIQDYNGQLVSNFNGYVYPKVVDKATLYTTLGNDGSSYPANFNLFDKVLFDGKTEVINGKFEFEFMVPKDIAYNYGYGKIRYYALDTVNYVDAWGAFDKLIIGGINEDAEVDDIGPEIELYLNGNSFISGDVVTNSPVLLSYISDESGVNSTGNGLGRDIVMVIDNDYSNSIIMNELFNMDVNSYKSGKIVYPFDNLSQGNHTLTIKAWDLQNNSSEKTIEFLVDNNTDIHLIEVLNYPNPFENETHFKFAHNKNGSQLEVVIRIYNIVGEFVVELENSNLSELDGDVAITWDGKSQDGSVVASGIYVYTIEVKDSYGNVTVQQQKLFKSSK
jgi:hypothetical protein